MFSTSSRRRGNGGALCRRRPSFRRRLAGRPARVREAFHRHPRWPRHSWDSARTTRSTRNPSTGSACIGTVAGNLGRLQSGDPSCSRSACVSINRITSEIALDSAPDNTIVHVDLDRSELDKEQRAHLPIESDAGYALKRLNTLTKAKNFRKPDLTAWFTTINGWKK